MRHNINKPTMCNSQSFQVPYYDNAVDGMSSVKPLTKFKLHYYDSHP